jgi:predicted enzyme related to lactoylglutathione lyase
MLLGLDAVIFRVPDLAEAKAWYGDAFGIEPYFDAPSYVGFDVGGFELGLVPDEMIAGASEGPIAHWGVADLTGALARLTERGAFVRSPPREVAPGIVVAMVEDPFGNPIGLIENPFSAPPAGSGTR